MKSNNNRTLGITLIGLGLLFLVMRYVQFDAMAFLWPLWILIPGAVLLFGAFSQRPAQIGLAIPGAVVTATGLILATFNTFGHWEAWSYVWAMYPIFVGLALYLLGKRNHDEALIANGRRLYTIGFYLLVGFAFFFEILIFPGAISWLDSAIVPVILIGLGLFLVFVKSAYFTDNQAPKTDAD
jgi:hypothetical protein